MSTEREPESGAVLGSFLRDHEQELMRGVLAYATRLGYARYTSTLEEAWRASIQGLSESIVTMVESRTDFEIAVDEDLSQDPAAIFGVDEARKHRSRGIDLGMFLALMKYYRQAYLDLITEEAPQQLTQTWHQAVMRFFDRLEIGFCTEWATQFEDVRMAELRASNRIMTNEKNKYLTVFESIHVPAILLDERGLIDNFNEAAARVFGLGEGSGSAYYSGHGVGQRFEPLTEAIERFVGSGAARLQFETVLRVGKTSANFVVSLQRMLDVSQKLLGITLAMLDVTELRRAEQEAQQNWRMYRNLFMNMPTAFAHHRMEYDDENRPVDYLFLEVNDAFEAMTGITREEAQGRLVIEVLPGIETSDFDWIGRFGSVVSDGGPLRFVAPADQLGRWYDVSAFPTEEGCFATVFLDVTEQRNHSQALERAVGERTAELEITNEQLRQASKIKDDFLASMSHELRTPLNSIIGFSGIMLAGMAGELTDEQASQLSMIRSSGEHLLELVNEILDLARIKAGHEELHVATFNLAKLTRDTLGLLEPLAVRKGLALELSSDDVLPMTGDAGKLRQVIMNLAANAINYTEEGLIEVSLTRTGEQVRLVVSDTGPGIAEEDLPGLFEEFTRLGRPYGEHPGSGLGLSISRHPVELMGGTLAVENRPGGGSCFVVVLPAGGSVAGTSEKAES